MPKDSARAWRCTVCGYIHRGPEPPESCPICGAAKADFEPCAEAAPQAPQPAASRWRCLNCGHVHAGPQPPSECPVCAATADRFEPLPDQPAAPTKGQAARVVIVGAGIAGVSAVEAARRASPEARITLLSKEDGLPYYRLNLTRFLAGEIGDDELPIHEAGWYGQQRVDLRTGVEVTALLLAEQAVELRGGERVPFEKLILTVGAHPFVPPLPGAYLEGVTSLRTAADARRILEASLSGMRCAVLGGGLLGLETAGALARRGADVTLIEGHEWLMPRQLNRRAGELLQQHVDRVGIQLRTRGRTKELVGDERVAGVLFEDGAMLPADLVVVATGIRPNSHLARRAGLEVNQGIVVNNHLVASHPSVLAAGDVAEHRGAVYGNWAASQAQGGIAGANAVGVGAEFGGIPRSNTLKVLGLDLLSIGKFEPEDGSYQVLEREGDGRYARFVFHDGRMVGAILLGDTSLASPLKKAIEGKADFSGILAQGATAGDVLSFLAAERA